MPGFIATDFNFLHPHTPQMAFFDEELRPLVSSVARGFYLDSRQAELIADLLASAATPAPIDPDDYEVTAAIGYALSASLPLIPPRRPPAK